MKYNINLKWIVFSEQFTSRYDIELYSKKMLKDSHTKQMKEKNYTNIFNQSPYSKLI